MMTIQVCLQLKYKFRLLIIDPNIKDYNQFVVQHYTIVAQLLCGSTVV